MRSSTKRRLARINEAFKPYAGITPEQQEALYQLVDACVALGGGQQPGESKMDAMARGLGLSCSAELRQILKDRAEGKLKPGEDWFDWRDCGKLTETIRVQAGDLARAAKMLAACHGR